MNNWERYFKFFLWIIGSRFRYPVNVGRNSGIHSGIIRKSAAVAVGGDTYLNSLDDNWATTVTLCDKFYFCVRILFKN